MSTKTRPMTAADLLRVPDDGFRYELVKGELRKKTPAGEEHGRITARLTWRLGKHVETNRLGAIYAAETGFLLSTDPDTVRALDVAFISQKRLERAGKVQGYWQGAPDLAVEVISPGDSYKEVEEKAIVWLQAGCSMVVVLDPSKQTVTVYRSHSDITILDRRAVLDIGEVVEGFSVGVHELFN